MSRKGSTPQRAVLPDPKHGSETIARFINMVMYSGKKSVAEKIVYGAMDVIGEKNPNPLEVVEKALGNISPSVEVKSRRDWRTSTGTWYVAPPTRRDLTSTAGETLPSAFSTSSSALGFFSPMASIAP